MNSYKFLKSQSILLIIFSNYVISDKTNNNLLNFQISWNQMMNKSELFIKSLISEYKNQFKSLEKSYISERCQESIWKMIDALDNSELWAFSSK